MHSTPTRSADRASKFVRDALLMPAQVQDVVLTPSNEQAKSSELKPAHIAHAHGDFGHADR